jgi:MarR family transcriptional regulator for hemolysin
VAAEARAPLSQSELAERLGVEGATMVAMIDRLRRAGLVQRQPSLIDRRINQIVVSEAGMLVAKAARSQAAALRRELCAFMDSKKLALAAEVLEMLYNRIEDRPSAAATITD